jgi:hypothetical protein
MQTYDAGESFSTGSAPPDFAIRGVDALKEKKLSSFCASVLTNSPHSFSYGQANCKSKRFSKKIFGQGKRLNGRR